MGIPLSDNALRNAISAWLTLAIAGFEARRGGKIGDEELAELSGLTRQTISALRNRKRGNPEPGTLEKLWAVLGGDPPPRMALADSVREEAIRYDISSAVHTSETSLRLQVAGRATSEILAAGDKLTPDMAVAAIQQMSDAWARAEATRIVEISEDRRKGG
jgi:transcriptional regulator with XRE-family HTH domain